MLRNKALCLREPTLNYCCNSEDSSHTALLLALQHNKNVMMQYSCLPAPGHSHSVPHQLCCILDDASLGNTSLLHRLTRIKLSHACLDGLMPTVLSDRCPSLQYLHMEHCELREMPPPGSILPACTSLQHLVIHDMLLPDDDVALLQQQLTQQLCALPKLSELRIEGYAEDLTFPVQCLTCVSTLTSFVAVNIDPAAGRCVMQHNTELMELSAGSGMCDDIFTQAMQLRCLKKLRVTDLQLDKPLFDNMAVCGVQLSCIAVKLRDLTSMPWHRLSTFECDDLDIRFPADINGEYLKQVQSIGKLMMNNVRLCSPDGVNCHLHGFENSDNIMSSYQLAEVAAFLEAVAPWFRTAAVQGRMHNLSLQDVTCSGVATADVQRLTRAVAGAAGEEGTCCLHLPTMRLQDDVLMELIATLPVQIVSLGLRTNGPVLEDVSVGLPEVYAATLHDASHTALSSQETSQELVTYEGLCAALTQVDRPLELCLFQDEHRRWSTVQYDALQALNSNVTVLL